MIEIRTNCENCNANLPANSNEAMFCAFECTFCEQCVTKVLHNVCPNCGGGFEKRPILPKAYLIKYPPSAKKILKPINVSEFEKIRNKFKDVPPSKR